MKSGNIKYDYHVTVEIIYNIDELAKFLAVTHQLPPALHNKHDIQTTTNKTLIVYLIEYVNKLFDGTREDNQKQKIETLRLFLIALNKLLRRTDSLPFQELRNSQGKLTVKPNLYEYVMELLYAKLTEYLDESHTDQRPESIKKRSQNLSVLLKANLEANTLSTFLNSIVAGKDLNPLCLPLNIKQINQLQPHIQPLLLKRLEECLTSVFEFNFEQKSVTDLQSIVQTIITLPDVFKSKLKDDSQNTITSSPPLAETPYQAFARQLTTLQIDNLKSDNINTLTDILKNSLTLLYEQYGTYLYNSYGVVKDDGKKLIIEDYIRIYDVMNNFQILDTNVLNQPVKHFVTEQLDSFKKDFLSILKDRNKTRPAKIAAYNNFLGQCNPLYELLLRVNQDDTIIINAVEDLEVEGVEDFTVEEVENFTVEGVEDFAKDNIKKGLIKNLQASFQTIRGRQHKEQISHPPSPPSFTSSQPLPSTSSSSTTTNRDEVEVIVVHTGKKALQQKKPGSRTNDKDTGTKKRVKKGMKKKTGSKTSTQPTGILSNTTSANQSPLPNQNPAVSSFDASRSSTSTSSTSNSGARPTTIPGQPSNQPTTPSPTTATLQPGIPSPANSTTATAQPNIPTPAEGLHPTSTPTASSPDSSTTTVTGTSSATTPSQSSTQTTVQTDNTITPPPIPTPAAPASSSNSGSSTTTTGPASNTQSTPSPKASETSSSSTTDNTASHSTDLDIPETEPLPSTIASLFEQESRKTPVQDATTPSPTASAALQNEPPEGSLQKMWLDMAQAAANAANPNARATGIRLPNQTKPRPNNASVPDNNTNEDTITPSQQSKDALERENALSKKRHTLQGVGSSNDPSSIPSGTDGITTTTNTAASPTSTVMPPESTSTNNNQNQGDLDTMQTPIEGSQTHVDAQPRSSTETQPNSTTATTDSSSSNSADNTAASANSNSAETTTSTNNNTAGITNTSSSSSTNSSTESSSPAATTSSTSGANTTTPAHPDLASPIPTTSTSNTDRTAHSTVDNNSSSAVTPAPNPPIPATAAKRRGPLGTTSGRFVNPAGNAKSVPTQSGSVTTTTSDTATATQQQGPSAPAVPNEPAPASTAQQMQSSTPTSLDTAPASTTKDTTQDTLPSTPKPPAPTAKSAQSSNSKVTGRSGKALREGFLAKVGVSKSNAGSNTTTTSSTQPVPPTISTIPTETPTTEAAETPTTPAPGTTTPQSLVADAQTQNPPTQQGADTQTPQTPTTQPPRKVPLPRRKEGDLGKLAAQRFVRYKDFNSSRTKVENTTTTSNSSTSSTTPTPSSLSQSPDSTASASNSTASASMSNSVPLAGGTSTPANSPVTAPQVNGSSPSVTTSPVPQPQASGSSSGSAPSPVPPPQVGGLSSGAPDTTGVSSSSSSTSSSSTSSIDTAVENKKTVDKSFIPKSDDKKSKIRESWNTIADQFNSIYKGLEYLGTLSKRDLRTAQADVVKDEIIKLQEEVSKYKQTLYMYYDQNPTLMVGKMVGNKTKKTLKSLMIQFATPGLFSYFDLDYNREEIVSFIKKQLARMGEDKSYTKGPQGQRSQVKTLNTDGIKDDTNVQDAIKQLIQLLKDNHEDKNSQFYNDIVILIDCINNISKDLISAQVVADIIQILMQTPAPIEYAGVFSSQENLARGSVRLKQFIERSTVKTIASGNPSEKQALIDVLNNVTFAKDQLKSIFSKTNKREKWYPILRDASSQFLYPKTIEGAIGIINTAITKIEESQSGIAKFAAGLVSKKTTADVIIEDLRGILQGLQTQQYYRDQLAIRPLTPLADEKKAFLSRQLVKLKSLFEYVKDAEINTILEKMEKELNEQTTEKFDIWISNKKQQLMSIVNKISLPKADNPDINVRALLLAEIAWRLPNNTRMLQNKMEDKVKAKAEKAKAEQAKTPTVNKSFFKFPFSSRSKQTTEESPKPTQQASTSSAPAPAPASVKGTPPAPPSAQVKAAPSPVNSAESKVQPTVPPASVKAQPPTPPSAQTLEDFLSALGDFEQATKDLEEVEKTETTTSSVDAETASSPPTSSTQPASTSSVPVPPPAQFKSAPPKSPPRPATATAKDQPTAPSLATVKGAPSKGRATKTNDSDPILIKARLYCITPLRAIRETFKANKTITDNIDAIITNLQESDSKEEMNQNLTILKNSLVPQTRRREANSPFTQEQSQLISQILQGLIDNSFEDVSLLTALDETVNKRVAVQPELTQQDFESAIDDWELMADQLEIQQLKTKASEDAENARKDAENARQLLVLIMAQKELTDSFEEAARAKVSEAEKTMEEATKQAGLLKQELAQKLEEAKKELEGINQEQTALLLLTTQTEDRLQEANTSLAQNQAKAKELEEKERHLAEKERNLNKREQEAEVKETSLVKREQAVETRDKLVRQLHTEASETRKALKKEKQDLETAQQQVLVDQAAITKRLQEAVEKETSLLKREQAVETRDKHVRQLQSEANQNRKQLKTDKQDLETAQQKLLKDKEDFGHEKEEFERIKAEQELERIALGEREAEVQRQETELGEQREQLAKDTAELKLKKKQSDADFKEKSDQLEKYHNEVQQNALDAEEKGKAAEEKVKIASQDLIAIEDEKQQAIQAIADAKAQVQPIHTKAEQELQGAEELYREADALRNESREFKEEAEGLKLEAEELKLEAEGLKADAQALKDAAEKQKKEAERLEVQAQRRSTAAFQADDISRRREREVTEREKALKEAEENHEESLRLINIREEAANAKDKRLGEREAGLTTKQTELEQKFTLSQQELDQRNEQSKKVLEENQQTLMLNQQVQNNLTEQQAQVEKRLEELAESQRAMEEDQARAASDRALTEQALTEAKTAAEKAKQAEEEQEQLLTATAALKGKTATLLMEMEQVGLVIRTLVEIAVKCNHEAVREQNVMALVNKIINNPRNMNVDLQAQINEVTELLASEDRLKKISNGKVYIESLQYVLLELQKLQHDLSTAIEGAFEAEARKAEREKNKEPDIEPLSSILKEIGPSSSSSVRTAPREDEQDDDFKFEDLTEILGNLKNTGTEKQANKELDASTTSSYSGTTTTSSTSTEGLDSETPTPETSSISSTSSNSADTEKTAELESQQARLTEVEDKLKARDEELANLLKQFEEYKAEIQRQKEEDAVKAQAQEQQVSETKTQAEEQLQTAKTREQELTSQAEKTTKKLGKTKDKLQTTEAELQVSKTELEETQTKLDKAETELEDTKTELEETRKNLQEANEKLNESASSSYANSEQSTSTIAEEKLPELEPDDDTVEFELNEGTGLNMTQEEIAMFMEDRLDKLQKKIDFQIEKIEESNKTVRIGPDKVQKSFTPEEAKRRVDAMRFFWQPTAEADQLKKALADKLQVLIDTYKNDDAVYNFLYLLVTNINHAKSVPSINEVIQEVLDAMFSAAIDLLTQVAQKIKDTTQMCVNLGGKHLFSEADYKNLSLIVSRLQSYDLNDVNIERNDTNDVNQAHAIILKALTNISDDILTNRVSKDIYQIILEKLNEIKEVDLTSIKNFPSVAMEIASYINEEAQNTNRPSNPSSSSSSSSS